MRSGCALYSPTLEWASFSSWSAASAPTNGTVKSLRKGETRPPVTSPMSLGYSTACGSPWEPSCSKGVTSLPGQSALITFTQCHIYTWGVSDSNFFQTLLYLVLNYALLSTVHCMLWRIWTHLDQVCLLSGWCILSRLTGIIVTLMVCSYSTEKGWGGEQYCTTNIFEHMLSKVLSPLHSLFHWILTEALGGDTCDTSFYNWGTTEMWNIFSRLHSW